MRDELLLPSERFGADLAVVRFVARMLLHVVRQVFFASERLLAELASMRRFARVYSAVKMVSGYCFCFTFDMGTIIKLSEQN